MARGVRDGVSFSDRPRDTLGGLLLLDDEVNDVTKFKVGDRVRVVRKVESAKGWKNIWAWDMDDLVGREGTVSAIAPTGIYFKEFDFGFPKEALALVPMVLTVDAAIASYTLACEQFETAELEVERAKAAVRDARLVLRDALDGES